MKCCMNSSWLALVLLSTQVHAGGRDESPTPPGPPASADASQTAPGHSIHGEAFNEGPRQHATLLPGMGKVAFRVTTSSAAAQQYISQGVAQLHSFYYFEAERSFRHAAGLDPACVMAYWGMAMSNVNNPKRAQGFLKKAKTEAEKASITDREARYIKALSALHNLGADDKGRTGQRGWISGLESIVQEFPDDLDARCWLVLAVLMSGDVGSYQVLDSMLDAVLRVEPMHPGAHHYRIHLWDNQKAVRALDSAESYAKAAPGIAHAWHMPGHTYTELRRYADAARHQEAAARVDHRAAARDRILPFQSRVEE